MNLRAYILVMCWTVLDTSGVAAEQTVDFIHSGQKECKEKTEQGKYEEALLICQRVVSELETVKQGHPDLAAALTDLATVIDNRGDYKEAMQIYLRSLKIRESRLGPEDPGVADNLESIAYLYRRQGEFQQAEQLYLRSLYIREKVFGPEALSTAESITGLAGLFIALGEYKKAETLFLRDLQIKEKNLGPIHPDVATSVNNLARAYHEQGLLNKAELLYWRGFRILEKKEGIDHPDLAVFLNNLARLYQDQGAFQKAESLFLRSLKIREKALGPSHPSIASSLNNLAVVYHFQGLYQQAEPLMVRGLQIFEKSFGREHPSVATSLNNLAKSYEARGASHLAEPLLLRSLKIREKLLGPSHPDVAISLHNLANLYKARGEYAQAEPLFLRSVGIWETALGLEHPNLAETLHSFARLYLVQGAYDRADTLSLRSLRIRERALGPDHPDVAESLYDLAELDSARGRIPSALHHLARALSIREKELRQAATEARVIRLLEKQEKEENLLYGLLLSPEMTAEVRQLVFRADLLRKGRAAEAGLVAGWAIQQSLTRPEQHQRFDTWQSLRSQHEALFLRGRSNLAPAAYQERLADLRNQIDAAEHELARAAPQFEQWKLPGPEQIIATIAGKLSSGSVLIELLQFKPYQLGTKGSVATRGAPRYAALLLFPDERVVSVDLGDAATIDRAAGELLLALRSPNKTPQAEARALHELVFAPLVPKLGNARRLYLSPDSSLNLVPFVALHDGKQYLLESDYQIQYLTSGRELLRKSLSSAGQPALVLADPDFSGKQPHVAQQQPRSIDDNTRGLYQSSTTLVPLPGARAEGQTVAMLLHTPPQLGAAATEPLLRAARSPSVLHIATHGLFLDGAAADSSASRSALLPVRPAQQDDMDRIVGKSGDTSLSHAALALAGAANAAQATDAQTDGLLTAEEARSLNLYGTQLVVLSACDSGRGTVKVGQGVYGLRRAFFAAGAEAVVMSLWPVADSATQSLMERYYRLLLDPKHPRPRIAALTEAMRAIKAEQPHPYYWAPFIVNGLDSPLHLK